MPQLVSIDRSGNLDVVKVEQIGVVTWLMVDAVLSISLALIKLWCVLVTIMEQEIVERKSPYLSIICLV